MIAAVTEILAGWRLQEANRRNSFPLTRVWNTEQPASMVQGVHLIYPELGPGRGELQRVKQATGSDSSCRNAVLAS